MIEYKPDEKVASLFDPFGVWIGGKRYEVKAVSVAMYNALLELYATDAGKIDEGNAEIFAREIMGEEAYQKAKPVNAFELQMLAKWMYKEFFHAISEQMEPANDQEKNDGPKPA